MQQIRTVITFWHLFRNSDEFSLYLWWVFCTFIRFKASFVVICNRTTGIWNVQSKLYLVKVWQFGWLVNLLHVFSLFVMTRHPGLIWPRIYIWMNIENRLATFTLPYPIYWKLQHLHVCSPMSVFYQKNICRIAWWHIALPL